MCFLHFLKKLVALIGFFNTHGTRLRSEQLPRILYSILYGMRSYITEKSMKTVKLAIITITLNFLFSGLLMAQQQKPSIYLDTFEKCNNYARHFCLNGSHEAAVNRSLLDMKRKGYSISAKVFSIKRLKGRGYLR